jgi:hypothetical protein
VPADIMIDKSEGKQAIATDKKWWQHATFDRIVKGVAIALFLTTGYLLVSAKNRAEIGGIAIAFVSATICALVGNLDKFEFLKASIWGIEAKTRELKDVVDEARVTLKEFHTLSEMIGGLLIELMAGAGRWGGNSSQYDWQRRQRVLDTLAAIGLTEDAVRRLSASDSHWVKIDYSLAIFGAIDKAKSVSPDLKAAAKDMLKKWNDEDFRPTPDDCDVMLKEHKCNESRVLDTVEDFRYFSEHEEHRRLDFWLNRRTLLQWNCNRQCHWMARAPSAMPEKPDAYQTRTVGLKTVNYPVEIGSFTWNRAYIA